MAQVETSRSNPPTPDGCLLELGELTAEQARRNWWADFREREGNPDTRISWHTAKIVSTLLSRLEESGSIEITNALVQVDQLLPDTATELERQQHFDCCIDAVDLTLAALRYSVREENGFIIHTPTEAANTSRTPVVEVPRAA